ncbi:MAG: DUF305 domain-containing protein [Dermatophilaceae bacterium]
MSTVARRLASLSVLTAALVLAGCTGVGDRPQPTRLTAAPPDAPTLTTTRAFSDADAEFVESMVRQHRRAIGLAALVPDRTDTPEVVALAEDITRARTAELDRLLDRLQEWGLPADATQPGPTGDLLGAEGAEFDRLWLEEMLEHHEEGISLAEDVLARGSHRPTLTFAEALVAANRAQVSRIEAMLGA